MPPFPFPFSVCFPDIACKLFKERKSPWLEMSLGEGAVQAFDLQPHLPALHLHQTAVIHGERVELHSSQSPGEWIIRKRLPMPSPKK